MNQQYVCFLSDGVSNELLLEAFCFLGCGVSFILQPQIEFIRQK